MHLQPMCEAKQLLSSDELCREMVLCKLSLNVSLVDWTTAHWHTDRWKLPLEAFWSLFLPNMSFFSCKNDSKQPNQTGTVWLVLRSLWKTASSCHLSLPPNSGDIGRKNCSVILLRLSRHFSYLFFHTRSECACGRLLWKPNV